MTALLLIDIQQGLDQAEHWGGSRNNPNAEENCRKLLEYFRQRPWPIFHIQHNSAHKESPLYPGKPGHRIKPIVAPLKKEIIIQKNTNSAFIGTRLKDLLDQAGVDSLIIGGLTTDHCVAATVKNAADLGYKTTLVADATATYAKTGVDGTIYNADLIYHTCLASLRGEFASIAYTDSVLNTLQ